MPRLSNHEPFGTRSSPCGWTPMDAATPAQEWADEHDKCEFCGREFHLDELEPVACEKGDLGCPECREYIAANAMGEAA